MNSLYNNRAAPAAPMRPSTGTVVIIAPAPSLVLLLSVCAAAELAPIIPVMLISIDMVGMLISIDVMLTSEFDMGDPVSAASELTMLE